MYNHLEGNGIELFEVKLLQILFDLGENCQFVLCRDFNTRTSNEPDYVIDDDISYLPVGQDNNSTARHTTYK